MKGGERLDLSTLERGPEVKAALERETYRLLDSAERALTKAEGLINEVSPDIDLDLLKQVEKMRERHQSVSEAIAAKKQELFENLLEAARLLPPNEYRYPLRVHAIGNGYPNKAFIDEAGVYLQEFEHSSQERIDQVGRSAYWKSICFGLIVEIEEYIETNLKKAPKNIQTEAISVASVEERIQELKGLMKALVTE